MPASMGSGRNGNCIKYKQGTFQSPYVAEKYIVAFTSEIRWIFITSDNVMDIAG